MEDETPQDRESNTILIPKDYPIYESFIATRFSLVETLLDIIPRDVCQEIKRTLVVVLHQAVVEAVRVGIPNEIISFAHFDLMKDSLVIHVEYKEDRKEIHDYCEKIGLNARTKWRLDADNPFYMCPYCRCYTADTLTYSDGEICGAYCNNPWCRGKNENETRTIITGYQCKMTQTKKRYISTGVMCIRRSDIVPLPYSYGTTYKRNRKTNHK